MIKNLWTSSFVLVAGGWSILLLGLFYSIIDGLGFHRWAWLWMVIGANAITIYMLQRIVHFREIADFLLGAIPESLGDTTGLTLLMGALSLKCLVLALMYRKKVFLRL
jgi:predicted acyltransferase